MVMSRITVFIALLLLGGAVASCGPDIPTEPSNNRLQTIPDTLKLTPIAPSAVTTMNLACGCTFDYTVTGYGDTTYIRYQMAPSQNKSSYTITATALPTAPQGSYSSWLSLSTPDSNPDNAAHIFYDTLHVTLIVP